MIEVKIKIDDEFSQSTHNRSILKHTFVPDYEIDLPSIPELKSYILHDGFELYVTTVVFVANEQYVIVFVHKSRL